VRGKLTHYVGIQSDITELVNHKKAELAARHAALQVMVTFLVCYVMSLLDLYVLCQGCAQKLLLLTHYVGIQGDITELFNHKKAELAARHAALQVC
jgi:hypothetical protein